MDLVSLKRKRKLIVILPLCASFISSYPLYATAGPDDTPVLKITQSTHPSKRTVEGTVFDASTGEVLIGVGSQSLLQAVKQSCYFLTSVTRNRQ